MMNGIRTAVVFGCLALAAAGCGGGPPTATVSGNITFEGKGLPAGNVLFVPAKGGANVSGSIADGQYTVENVPVGDMKVVITVLTQASVGGGPFAGKGVGWEKKGPPKGAPIPEGFDPKKANAPVTVKIPAQYSDPDKTPLNYTVIAGKQQKDFEIK